ncbi:hypothetical protein P7D22_21560, partial [Lichenihabitans sp. Uapishka_5]|nr:hypothetical protein [Lichenihabitans sp. Uapishka_5]
MSGIELIGRVLVAERAPDRAVSPYVVGQRVQQEFRMSLPSTMTVIEATGAGGPEVLRPGERPVPVPRAGEVLIRVAAAGVNRPDV